MKRRDFMKAMGALGVSTVAPSLFTDQAFIKYVQASPAIQQANVSLASDTVTPQVINIFLYGGASELAGNLSNIQDIARVSQSSYTELNPNFLNVYDPLNPNFDPQNAGQVTPNAFWAHAGGIIMEDMLAEGDMTIYRTCNRRKNNTRAHRPSIFSGQKGTLDIDSAPGVGTTLAAVIANNRAAFEGLWGKPLEELVMPMVSFEGESTIFAPDPNADTPIPLALKPIGLSSNFDNPYERSAGTRLPEDDQIDDLIDQKMKLYPTDDASDELSAYGERYKKVSESFLNHRKLGVLVDNFRTIIDDDDRLPLLPEGDPDGSNPDFDILLFNAYNNAVNSDAGRFFQHTLSPNDPLVPLTPEGNGLDNIWIDVPVLDNNGIPMIDPLTNQVITQTESRFVDLQGQVIDDPDNDLRLQGGPGNNRLVYPQNNRFAELLRAAVTLSIYNPDTKFVMVGSPGLGGWDDHNSAMTEYETRMQTLMSAVRAAVKHIKYAHDDPEVQSATYRNGASTDNIIINIYTDFGRNANLNNSRGWDHGNTQNLYTFGGRPLTRDPDYVPVSANDLIIPVKNVDKTSVDNTGAAVRPIGALGKIVGTTRIFGTPGQNRIFTKPAESSDDGSLNVTIPPGENSYEFEPQAIGATVYSWFGVTNPEVLTQNNDPDFATGDVTRHNGTTLETVSRAAGEPGIDETLASLPLFLPPPVKNIVT